jgi:hypothetical protein
MTTDLPALVDRQRVNAAADEWNRLHPVGTPVIAYPGGRPEDFPNDERIVTTTRSKATVLSGHTAVVWVHGHSACIALTHIDVRTHATAGELAEFRHLLIDADPDATTRQFVDLRKGRKL